MPLTVKTGPTSEPIDLEAAKRHLHIDFGDDDRDITDLIGSVRSAVEVFLQGPLLPTVYTYTLDAFPPVIRLPVGPVQAASDVSIDYLDTTGASQSLDAADFEVSTGEAARVRPAYGMTWPSVRREMDAVTVTFTAGYKTKDDIPPAIVGAMKAALFYFHENREAAELPNGARNLLMPFVRWT